MALFSLDDNRRLFKGYYMYAYRAKDVVPRVDDLEF